MAVEVLTQTELTESKEYDLACFVLLADNKNYNIEKPSYTLPLLGRPMFEWVTRACPTRATTIECLLDANVLATIKPYLKEREWTLVLYGDTPLITRAHVNEILNFVEDKGLNVCKLSRGFVFRTEYIKRVDEIFAPQTYYFREEEFEMASNLSEFANLQQILKDRIIAFHSGHGVCFVDPATTYIECEVAIGANSIIGPNVYLSGETEILNDVTIGAGSKIVSSKIGTQTNIAGSSIFESVVKENCNIGEGVVLSDSSFVGAGSCVGAASVIKSSSLSQNVSVGSKSFLENARIYRDSKIGSNCSILGEAENLTRLLKGVTIKDASIIGPGVAIKEDTVVPFGTKLTD